MSHNPDDRSVDIEKTEYDSDHPLQDNDLAERMIHNADGKKIYIDNTLFY